MRRSQGKPQRRTSKAERSRIVESFERSGLTRRGFAEQNGLARSTLDYWLKQARRADSSGVPKKTGSGLPARSRSMGMSFAELELVSFAGGSSGEWAVEVVSPQGLTIRFREAPPPEVVVRLLGAC